MTTPTPGRARALRTLAAAVGLAGAVFSPLGLTHVSTANAQAHPACGFVLGFAVLRDRLPATVGVCLEDQQTNVANGDAYQRTTGGMLVWRKADNWTAFTDGYRTWVNGPRGLEERLNTQRFTWEGDADAPGAALLVDAPAPPQVPPASPAAPPGPPPAPSAGHAAQGLWIVSVTPLARRNSYATLVAQTVPGATCGIVVTYKSGASQASGLVPKTADAQGGVSWTWMIGRATTLGEWPVDVACEAGGERFTARTAFIAG
jgi:hypothetical protein